mmetsp:Transcript_52123/g.58228  ORF Transcript_52123/g.58228 Transcript_52123/m.58228 type:complete len:234 (-) Transcript_52123:488-1189(-)
MGLSFTTFKSLPTYLRIKSLLTNHHLQGYRLFHHILQPYHPLYNKDGSNHIIERPQQQFYDNSTRRSIKLPMQEYYDVYAFYLKLGAYTNDSFKTLVSPSELCIFVNRCIRSKKLYQVTRYDCENDEFRYKFLPHNLAQTLQLEFSNLCSDRRFVDRFSDHCFDRSSDQPYDCSQPNGSRSYTPRRAYGSSATAAGTLPDHQDSFLNYQRCQASPWKSFYSRLSLLFSNEPET